MKTNSMIKVVAAVAALMFFIQCGGKKEASSDAGTMEHASTDAAAVTSSGPLFTVDATFQEQLVRTFNAYVKMKDAFVASDPSLVKAEAMNVTAIVKAIDTKMLTGPALNDWSNYSNNLNLALAEITATDDIEAQRTAFSSLSDNLYKSIKAYGLGTTTAYYDFCPMAFNDQGGYWLSDKKEIRNPYFGDKMLTCGRVTEELK